MAFVFEKLKVTKQLNNLQILLLEEDYYLFPDSIHVLRKLSEKILSDIDVWLNTRKCQFAIAAKFPLKDVVQAHELIESGNKIGHIILEID